MPFAVFPRSAGRDLAACGKRSNGRPPRVENHSRGVLHGLGDTSRSWSLILPELAKSHRVYAFDQRGHGAASAPRCCYALSNLAFDAIAFVDAMKVERASVVGHSMGSFVAQHPAAHYPERVQKLVLIGSSDTTVGSDQRTFVRTIRQPTLILWGDDTAGHDPHWEMPGRVAADILRFLKEECRDRAGARGLLALWQHRGA